MGSELVPRPSFTPVNRQFRGQVKSVNGFHLLERMEEQHRADLLDQRIDNAVYLAQKSMVGLSTINQLGAALSAGNQGLEMEMRVIEEGLCVGLRNVVVNYVNRR